MIAAKTDRAAKKISGWKLLETPVVLAGTLISYEWGGIWYGLVVFVVGGLICHFVFGRN